MSDKSRHSKMFLVFIFVFLNNRILRCKSELNEVTLSPPPLLVCECANESDNNECKENFKDWLIIRDGFLLNFTHTDERFDVQENETQHCYEEVVNNHICTLLKLMKVVILGTGHRRQLHNLLDNKDHLVLCPNSIHKTLSSLKIKSVKEIYISPETVTERETSLHLELRNIEGNLNFPIGFYDYNYKITDESTERYSKQKLHKEPVIISLYLFEVRNVKIESNSISTDGVKLSITYATSLIIESSAVFDLLPGLSGISLNEIDAVDIYSSWSNYLIIDLCKSVNLYTRSISDSVHHLMLSNIINLVTREYSFTPKTFSILSTSNIRKWIPFSNSIVSNFPSQSHTNLETKNAQSQVIMKNITVFAKGKNSILLICNKLCIEMAQFFIFSKTNHSKKTSEEFSSELRIGSGDYDINSNKYENYNTYEIEEKPTLLFVTSSFETDVRIPNWVYICLLNDSITCPIDRTTQKCPFGFPYNFGDEDYKQLGCQESKEIIDVRTVLYEFLLSFGGGLVLFLSILIIYVLIQWQNKKHANWSPNQLNMTCMTSSTAALEGIPQLIHVPPRESQIAFTFPERFSGKTSPSRNETLMAVNLYYGEGNHNQNNEEKMTTSIELLRVKFLDESVESDDVWAKNITGYDR